MLIYFFMLHPKYLVFQKKKEDEEEEVAVPILPPSFQTNQNSKTFWYMLCYVTIRTSATKILWRPKAVAQVAELDLFSFY